MKLPALLGLLALLSVPLRASGQDFQSSATATPLIELYTSEGCSSCPPADRWLGALKTDPDLWQKFVPVAFHVTYWDDLGWKDPLAQPAFTARQRAYAAAWNAASVYTPAFVRQGREWHPGAPTPPSVSPGILTIHRDPAGIVTLRFTPTDPSPGTAYTGTVALLGAGLVVPVRAGENAGRSLPHDFIALHLVTLPLALQSDGTLAGTFAAPSASLPATPRRALAAWISLSGTQAPLQAAGGWLP